eukprot:RCo053241
MDSLRLALVKLNGLQGAGVVSEEEFEVYRKQLLAHHKTLRELHGSNRSSPAPSTSASPCLTPALPPATATSLPEQLSPVPPTPQRLPASVGRSSCAESPQARLLTPPRLPFYADPSSSWARDSPSSSRGVFLEKPCSSSGSSTPQESDEEGPMNSTPGNFAVKLQPLPPAATTADLTLAMSIFGLVVGAVVNKGKPNYGYVRFAEEASAQAAKAAASVVVCNRKVRVRSSKWRAGAPDSEPEPSCFVGLFNLPFRTTESWLQLLLERFPGFLNVRMMVRKGGRFAGHAFAQFRSIEEATVCRVSLAGLTLEGQTIDVKFATRPQQ